MTDLKQIKDFNLNTKLRQIVSKELHPTLQKFQNQITEILNMITSMNEKVQSNLKFEHEKQIIEKNIKQMKANMTNVQQKLISNVFDHLTKSSSQQINQNKTQTQIHHIKQELDSIQKNLLRKDEKLGDYDRHIKSVTQKVLRNERFIQDRIKIFEQSFRRLAKDTLELAQEAKRQFNQSSKNNEHIRSELLRTVKMFYEKQKQIYQLSVSQAGQDASIDQIRKELQKYAEFSDVQKYVKTSQCEIAKKINSVSQKIDSLVSNDVKANLKLLNVKFAQIEEIKHKMKKVDDIKNEIDFFRSKLQQIQAQRSEQLNSLRLETEDRQQKIIEVFDKKLETIEDNLDKINVKEQSIEQKISHLKQQILKDIKIQNEQFRKQIQQYQMKSPLRPKIKQAQPQLQESHHIHHEEIDLDPQLNQFQQKCQQIKKIAENIQHKISQFTNRLTICRSDIDLFIDSSTKELKRIKQIRQTQEEYAEHTGKALSSIVQSLMILTSIAMNSQKINHKITYVTFNDGVILDLTPQQNNQEIKYRRSFVRVNDLKDSLLHGLSILTDQIIQKYREFKWQQRKPSDFHKDLLQIIKKRKNSTSKDNMLSLPKEKSIMSPKHRIRKSSHNIQSAIQFHDSQQLSFKITVPSDKMQSNNFSQNNGFHAPITLEIAKSEVQRRYKLKKRDQRIAKEMEERNCFTASKSHRKSRPSIY